MAAEQGWDATPDFVTRTASCWVSQIVRARFSTGADVELADAVENIANVTRCVKGRRLPVVVDMRSIRSQSAGARAYFAGPEATQVTIALALVVSSPVSRVLGNFFLGVNRPAVPTRLFGDVETAERWLSRYLAA
jgi:hypothetical protein